MKFLCRIGSEMWVVMVFRLVRLLLKWCFLVRMLIVEVLLILYRDVCSVGLGIFVRVLWEGEVCFILVMIFM